MPLERVLALKKKKKNPFKKKKIHTHTPTSSTPTGPLPALEQLGPPGGGGHMGTDRARCFAGTAAPWGARAGQELMGGWLGPLWVLETGAPLAWPAQHPGATPKH